MSEIDAYGLEAACGAYCNETGNFAYTDGLRAAIRAYEAHMLPKRAEHMAKMADMVHEQALSEAAYAARKASADTSEYLDTTIKAMEYLERAQRAEKALEARKASAVPEECDHIATEFDWPGKIRCRCGAFQVDDLRPSAIPEEMKEELATLIPVLRTGWATPEDLRIAANLLERAYSRAVPEEIAEVVKGLHGLSGELPPGTRSHNVVLRAADLLECYARQAAPAKLDKQA